MTDTDRERLIESFRTIVEVAREKEWKHIAELRMRELIAQRSPEKIREMEKSRGLRVS